MLLFSLLSLRYQLCFYETSSELCVKGTNEIYGPGNYSLFAENTFVFVDNLEIQVTGNVNYLLNFSTILRKPELTIYGKNAKESSISILPNFSLFNVSIHDIALKIPENADCSYISQISIRKTKFICSDDFILFSNKTAIDFYSLSTLSLISSISIDCNLESFNIEKFENKTIIIDSNTVNFKDFRTDITIGFYNNKILFWEDPRKMISLFLSDQSSILFEHSNPNTWVTYTCLLSPTKFYYQKLYISVVDSGNIRFAECSFPYYQLEIRNNPFADVTVTGTANIEIDTSYLPVSFFFYNSIVNLILGSQTVVLPAQDFCISGKVNISTKNNIESALSVSDFYFFSDSLVYTTNKVIVYSDILSTISDDPFITLTGDGFYDFSFFFIVQTSKITVTNIVFQDKVFWNLDQPKPTTQLFVDGQCISKSSRTYIYCNECDPGVPDNSILLSISGSSVDYNMQIYLRGNIVKTQYKKGTYFPSLKRENKQTMGLISLTVENLTQNVNTAYCLASSKEQCPHEYHHLPESEFNIFPGYKGIEIDYFFFYVAPNYVMHKALPFNVHAMNHKNIRLNINGNGGNFIFDGRFFNVFQNLTIYNTKCIIDSQMPPTNLHKVEIYNSTFDETFEKALLKAMFLEIDYNTLMNMHETNFKQRLSILPYGHPITYTGDGIIINKKKFICVYIALYANNNDIEIIGNCSEEHSSLSLAGVANRFIISGTFPSSFMIDIDIPVNEVVINMMFPPISFMCESKFTIVSNLTNIYISDLCIIFNETTVSMPENSELVFMELVITAEGSIVGNKGVDVHCNALAGLTYNFEPSKVKYDQAIIALMAGANIVMNEAPKKNTTLLISYNLAAMPVVKLNNGNYSMLNDIVFEYKSSSPIQEEKAYKSNPSAYLQGMPIICGENIACDNWDIQFSGSQYYVPKNLYGVCQHKYFGNETCVVVYGKKDVIPPEPIFINEKTIIATVYSTAAGIFILGVIALVVNFSIKRKRNEYSLSIVSIPFL